MSSMPGCPMISLQSGHLMLLKVRRQPPAWPFRTMASAQCLCIACPQLRSMVGAPFSGSVQQIGHHSSPSGILINGTKACDPVLSHMASTERLLDALHSGRRQGRHFCSPRTPPHQWPQSECLFPQAVRSFSAQDKEGGNLLRSVPSSLPQQGLHKLSDLLIFAIQGCEHHRQEPTGQAWLCICSCFCQPSQDQPQ